LNGIFRLNIPVDSGAIRSIALSIFEEGGGRGMMMAGGWVNGWLSSPSESFDDSDQSGGDVMGDVLV
jgi:hypothetical protein